MDYYKTIADFDTVSPTLAFFQSIATAIPPFFAILIFVFWILGSATSYFVILKITGKKRFFHAITSMSFSMVLFSSLIASMNTTEVTILNGYWIGFYILMTAISWMALRQYK